MSAVVSAIGHGTDFVAHGIELTTLRFYSLYSILLLASVEAYA
jgi:hypothetical protein